MIISNQKVKIKWHPSNKKYYEFKGYVYTKFKDEFEIDIKDISSKSKTIIKVQCDYCKNIFEKKYQNYINEKEKSIIKKDCCKKCIPLKNKETFKKKYNGNGPYGVDDIRKKIENTNLKKYNTKYPMQNEKIKNKSLKNRYGDDKNGSNITTKNKD